MTDHPILFSAPMIRALLDGRKTQTRRVLKDQPGDLDKPFMMDDGSWHVTDSQGGHMSPLAVRFAKGDRLWVREALRRRHINNILGDSWVYAADQEAVSLIHGDPRIPAMFSWAHHKEGDTCVSIHMPHWASRLTLTVTDVRVQRLQEISEVDAIAEGIERRSTECSDGVTRGLWYGVPECGTEHAVTSYSHLWESINNPRGLCAEDAPSGWAANPWVCAISFEVLRCNIDKVAT